MSRVERKRDKDKEHFYLKFLFVSFRWKADTVRFRKVKDKRKMLCFSIFLMKAKHKILSQPFFFPTSAETANLHQ